MFDSYCSILSNQVATTPRRVRLSRATKDRNEIANRECLPYREQLGNKIGPDGVYTRVNGYVSANEEETSEKGGPKAEGQRVARFLLMDRSWCSWFNNHNGNVVTFKGDSPSFTCIYGIDELKEGKEIFYSYEALAQWARTSGFYDEHMAPKKAATKKKAAPEKNVSESVEA